MKKPAVRSKPSPRSRAISQPPQPASESWAGDLAGVPADTILISDLEVWYRVGVPDAERARPQRLLLTVEMQPRQGFGPAAAADDLARTIDYFAVSRRLLGLGEGREWRLIETLAAEIAELVLAEFGAATARVAVKKFILPETAYVGVRVERRAAGEGRPRSHGQSRRGRAR